MRRAPLEQLALSGRGKSAAEGATPSKDVTGEYAHTQNLPNGSKRVTYDYVTGEGVRVLEEYRYDADGNLLERKISRRRETTDPKRFERDQTRRYEEEVFVSDFDENGEPRNSTTLRRRSEAPNGSAYEEWLTRHSNGEVEGSAVHREASGQEYPQAFPVHLAQPMPEAPPLTEGPPLFSVEEMEVELPGGGRQLVTRFEDQLSGVEERQVTEYDRQGFKDTLTTETVRKPERVSNDVAGLGLLAGLINNPQALLNTMDGELTQTQVSRAVETFDPPGRSQQLVTVWSSDKGTVTRIEQEGRATRWELQKTEGDRKLTQSFVEGSEDTTISEQFTDDQGFQVVNTQSDTSDLAELRDKEGVPSFTESSVARKETATVEDLRRLLGQQAFDELQQDSEAFQRLLDQFESGEFELSHLESRLDFADGKQKDVEAITLASQAGAAALVRDQDGKWRVSDLPDDFSQLGEEETAELLGNPANAALLAFFPPVDVGEAGRYMGWGNRFVDSMGQRLGAPALGPVMGLVGGGMVFADGMRELIEGDPYQGSFQLMAGGGAMLSSLAGLGSSVGINAGAAAVLGPIGWVLASAGTGLGLTYSYMDRHRIADLAI